MPMMNVRVMMMAVGQRVVLVGVSFNQIHSGSMLMQVMFIVNVGVRMLHQLVGVIVLMPLGQVQPDTCQHQRGRGRE